jgi:cytidine diphosphoramidate kinase
MRGVIWITGLSGSGKTTLARRVVRGLRDDGKWVIHVDGDRMRDICGNDLGHGEHDRRVNAWRVARTCEFLASEGAFVVCSTTSMFEEIWDYNRAHLSPYLEVLLTAPTELLRARDKHATHREERDARGLDFDVAWPTDADLVLSSHDEAELARNADIVLDRARGMIMGIDVRRIA